MWQHRDLCEQFLIHLQIHTPIKGCLVLHLASATTCKKLAEVSGSDMLIGSSYAARESQWHQIFAGPLGEMLNMETLTVTFLFPLYIPKHIQHTHILKPEL